MEQHRTDANIVGVQFSLDSLIHYISIWLYGGYCMLKQSHHLQLKRARAPPSKVLFHKHNKGGHFKGSHSMKTTRRPIHAMGGNKAFLVNQL